MRDGLANGERCRSCVVKVACPDHWVHNDDRLLVYLNCTFNISKVASSDTCPYLHIACQNPGSHSLPSLRNVSIAAHDLPQSSNTDKNCEMFPLVVYIAFPYLRIQSLPRPPNPPFGAHFLSLSANSKLRMACPNLRIQCLPQFRNLPFAAYRLVLPAN